jgi:hypothetical protein
VSRAHHVVAAALAVQQAIAFPPEALAPWPEAPALWSPSGELLLPERVRLISLHQPYAGLVIEGVKALETREWPWPYGPSWLAVFAARNGVPRATLARLGELAERHREPQGVVLGLVWVAGCRPMRPEDAGPACYPFDPKRFVWGLRCPTRFAAPIPLERGPQKFASIPRAQVAAALHPPPRE